MPIKRTDQCGSIVCPLDRTAAASAWMMGNVELVYRLDLTVDLFAFTIEGTVVVVGQDELEAIHADYDALRAARGAPDPEQMWSAIITTLGRDPRR